MPPGAEVEARRFYADFLGLREVPKPANLAVRGGAWFESDCVAVHLGVEQDFRPARKAHVAFIVDDVRGMARSARAAGFEVDDDEALDGFDRVYIYDSFGNRLEMLQRLSTNT